MGIVCYCYGRSCVFKKENILLRECAFEDNPNNTEGSSPPQSAVEDTCDDQDTISPDEPPSECK